MRHLLDKQRHLDQRDEWLAMVMSQKQVRGLRPLKLTLSQRGEKGPKWERPYSADEEVDTEGPLSLSEQPLSLPLVLRAASSLDRIVQPPSIYKIACLSHSILGSRLCPLEHLLLSRKGKDFQRHPENQELTAKGPSPHPHHTSEQ